MEQASKILKVRQCRRTSAEVKDLVEAYKQSGLSVKAFCRTRSINPNSFRNQIARIERKGLAPGFITVRAIDENSAREATLFAEYRGIKFYQQVDAAFLKALLC